jgi:hypothetical protein
MRQEQKMPQFKHSARQNIAPRGGFLQVVVSEATAADSDEATQFLFCGRF